MNLFLEDRIVNSKKKLMVFLISWNIMIQTTKMFMEIGFIEQYWIVEHYSFLHQWRNCSNWLKSDIFTLKEAEDIPLAAFEFWTDKKVKILFEEEINKFLWSDLSSDIDGYAYEMIPLMIKVKKHIDQLPDRIKKEELRDTKLKDFVKLPIEKQRQELISEQKKFWIFWIWAILLSLIWLEKNSKEMTSL